MMWFQCFPIPAPKRRAWVHWDGLVRRVDAIEGRVGDALVEAAALSHPMELMGWLEWDMAVEPFDMRAMEKFAQQQPLSPATAVYNIYEPGTLRHHELDHGLGCAVLPVDLILKNEAIIRHKVRYPFTDVQLWQIIGRPRVLAACRPKHLHWG